LRSEFRSESVILNRQSLFLASLLSPPPLFYPTLTPYLTPYPNHRYFSSWFHTLDALVIAAGFIVDVLLHGALEEVASLVVVLRLWRFFKIIEELGVGAEEQRTAFESRIQQLELENIHLRRRLEMQKGASP
jgi:hypothetical protein